MQITRLVLKNWRNFRQVDVPFGERTYLIGPNASGKSNFLDVFRFLRDVAKPSGGGLQKALTDRGGIKKIRCLQARSDPEIRIEIHLTSDGADPSEWVYSLGFKGSGAVRPAITEETVIYNGKTLLQRPDSPDRKDALRLSQTHLEQIIANEEFRELAVFLQATTYLHLVPQLLKFGDRHLDSRFDDDPFGQGFLQRIAKAQGKTRDARLSKIQKVLVKAVPFFKEIKFVKDPITGHPHLEARYEHWRPQGAWHREDEFSDGTLRLIGLLWSLFDGSDLLLLEEPELSLNDAIVERIPLMVDRILRANKTKRQILISTHSASLLSNPLDSTAILILEPSTDGTVVRSPNETETPLLDEGFSPAEVLLPKTRPKAVVRSGL